MCPGAPVRPPARLVEAGEVVVGGHVLEPAQVARPLPTFLYILYHSYVYIYIYMYIIVIYKYVHI